MGLASQSSTIHFLAKAAPLFEEKRDVSVFTLLLDRKHPLFFHRPRAWTTLATDYHPRDPIERKDSNVFEEWLDGEEANCGGGILKVGDSRKTVFPVLDRNAPPNVRLCCRLTQRARQQCSQAPGALRQYLVCVPTC